MYLHAGPFDTRSRGVRAMEKGGIGMKRILSLALSLILAWSLSIPTLAAEDLNPPLWQQMGFSSREECITSVYGDEDAYEEAVQEALERQQWEDSKAAEIASLTPMPTGSPTSASITGTMTPRRNSWRIGSWRRKRSSGT